MRPSANRCGCAATIICVASRLNKGFSCARALMKLGERLAAVTSLKSIMWENAGSKPGCLAKSTTAERMPESVIAPVNFEYTVIVEVLISTLTALPLSSWHEKALIPRNLGES